MDNYIFILMIVVGLACFSKTIVKALLTVRNSANGLPVVVTETTFKIYKIFGAVAVIVGVVLSFI